MECVSCRNESQSSDLVLGIGQFSIVVVQGPLDRRDIRTLQERAAEFNPLPIVSRGVQS
jgi:hypothetical protein